MAYCVAADLYSYGMPRGGFPNPARLVASVSAADDTLELDEHGFSLNDQVLFRAEAGGTLPAPLAAATTYYVIPVNDSTLQVAASSGGAAIDLTTAGSNIRVIAPLPIQAAIDWGAALIDDMLPAHAGGLEAPYPELIKATNAELAVSKLATFTGRGGDSLTKMIDAANARLARWAKGAPLKGADAPANRTNLAASLSVPSTSARGWPNGGCLP